MVPSLADTILSTPIREEWIAALAIGGSFGIALVAIVANTIQKTLRTRAKEQSRREIAAYIAEGSISPEDGARLIAAGESLKDKVCG